MKTIIYKGKEIIAKEQEDLEGVEKEVYDLCTKNPIARDSNTELCISFWMSKRYDFLPDDYPCGPCEIELFKAIRKYPPESLTKYRRNLIAWGLIEPSESSKKHSEEMEAQNHKPEAQIIYEKQEAKILSQKLF